jgi:hypothetical protein
MTNGPPEPIPPPNDTGVAITLATIRTTLSNRRSNRRIERRLNGADRRAHADLLAIARRSPQRWATDATATPGGPC